MKKSFFFAALFAALTLAFTACNDGPANGNDPSDPSNPQEQDDSVVLNATGELRGVMFDIYNTNQQAVITLHPKAKTVDVKFVQARIAAEDETPQDIYIYNMPVSTEEGHFAHIDLVLADGSAYAPFPKSYAYAMMDKERTMFNMHFGNDDENDTQVYLVFNAMLKSEQPPVDFNPADLIGSDWRTDSVFANGEITPAPHFYLQILEADKAVVNNDTIAYHFEENLLVCDMGKYEVVAFNGTTATLKDAEAPVEMYLSKMPEFDSDAMFFEPKSEDFVGTWKLAYYTMNTYGTGPDFVPWHNLSTNPGVETWQFNADGSATYHNTFTGETQNGEWSWEYGLQMVNNPAQGILIDENDRITVQPLTKNWMSILRGTGSGSITTYYQWWFVRVK